jgi:F0F1-type ATP synthase membrane subunit b/b'
MNEARERFEQELKRIQSELYAEMEDLREHAEQELKLATGALAEKLTITYSIINRFFLS